TQSEPNIFRLPSLHPVLHSRFGVLPRTSADCSSLRPGLTMSTAPAPPKLGRRSPAHWIAQTTTERPGMYLGNLWTVLKDFLKAAMSNEERHFYEFGPFRLDPVKRRLLREGEPLPLTPKAFDTLLALVEQGGKTIEKEDLMKKVWPDAIVEENNLN